MSFRSPLGMKMGHLAGKARATLTPRCLSSGASHLFSEQRTPGTRRILDSRRGSVRDRDRVGELLARSHRPARLVPAKPSLVLRAATNRGALSPRKASARAQRGRELCRSRHGLRRLDPRIRTRGGCRFSGNELILPALGEAETANEPIGDSSPGPLASGWTLERNSDGECRVPHRSPEAAR